MEHVDGKDLFGKQYEVFKPMKRGDLLKYFADRTGYRIGFVAKKVEGLNVQDLFYIKSVADKSLLEGKKNSFKHAFDTEIKRIWNSNDLSQRF